MFGNGYTPKEALELPEGIYEATITKVEDKNAKGYHFIEVQFGIDGYNGYRPNKFSFFDRPTVYNEKEQWKADRWDVELTTFFDSFCIQRGNFDINSWNGKRGTIKIKRDKNGFLNAYSFVNKNTELPRQEQSSKTAESFPEDIPYTIKDEEIPF